MKEGVFEDKLRFKLFFFQNTLPQQNIRFFVLGFEVRKIFYNRRSIVWDEKRGILFFPLSLSSLSPPLSLPLTISPLNLSHFRPSYDFSLRTKHLQKREKENFPPRKGFNKLFLIVLTIIEKETEKKLFLIVQKLKIQLHAAFVFEDFLSANFLIHITKIGQKCYFSSQKWTFFWEFSICSQMNLYTVNNKGKSVLGK